MKTDTKTVLNLFVVFAILAALTCGIDLKVFKRKLQKPKGVSIGLLCQFGILPVSSFLIAYLMNDLFETFSQPQGVALIILGSCPGGNVSNIFCFLWNADLSLSIAMTTASSVLSFLFLTGNCALYIPLFTRGSDTATIDYISLAFSVGMVVSGMLVGFIAAYLDNTRMKKTLGITGAIAALYMIYTALFGNATGSAPLWELPGEIWIAPLLLGSVAWSISLLISLVFKLPKKSVLSVCLESANQNSVLSAAIIYLSLDEYSQDDIDLAIGIPIMYTLTCVLFNVIGGLAACQLNWVSCKPPGDPGYIEEEEEDETLTLVHVIYRYRQWRHSRNTAQLLNAEDIDYGGTNGALANVSLTLEPAYFSKGDIETEKSSNDLTLTL
eukprot:1033471_1